MSTDPTVQALLQATAELARYAQARPTDSKGIRVRRKVKGRCEAAWLAAGCPGLQDGKAKSMPVRVAMPGGAGKPGRDGKDCTPVRMLLEVRMIRSSAAQLTDGDSVAWSPLALLWSQSEYEGRKPTTPDDLEVGGYFDGWAPRWLVNEKGWT